MLFFTSNLSNRLYFKNYIDINNIYIIGMKLVFGIFYVFIQIKSEYNFTLVF